jgi:hypothetical protein
MRTLSRRFAESLVKRFKNLVPFSSAELRDAGQKTYDAKARGARPSIDIQQKETKRTKVPLGKILKSLFPSLASIKISGLRVSATE